MAYTSRLAHVSKFRHDLFHSKSLPANPGLLNYSHYHENSLKKSKNMQIRKFDSKITRLFSLLFAGWFSIVFLLDFKLPFVSSLFKHEKSAVRSNENEFMQRRSLHSLHGRRQEAVHHQPTFPAYLESKESDFKTSTIRTVADVDGANMDHVGSVSNPCLTERSLLRRAVQEEVPAPFDGFGLHSFVLYDAHRVDVSTFVAIGLTPLELHGQLEVGKCMWLSNFGGVIQGRVDSMYPGEHHDLMYETVIFQCTLDQETTRPVGGSLYLIMDGQSFDVYEEVDPLPGPDILMEPSPKYNIGFCSFPIYRDVVADRIAEWVQYSFHVLGVEYFVLNDGGSIDREAYKILKPFVDSGIMEINDIRGIFQYESKHNVLVLNECIYRMRWIAKWSLVLDFDEYLYVPPPRSLPSLLAAHIDTPWLTFGSLWWSTELCRFGNRQNEWPIEKMMFHWPEFYCVGKDQGYSEFDCLNYHGHRKYIINTQKVSMVEVHRPVEPIDGGINLNTSVAFINHFQGLLRSSLSHCSSMVAKSKGVEWWMEDDFLAGSVQLARERGIPKFIKLK